ncbi:MAG: hypothetical protein ACYTBJ_26320 [Planctomycetota bacterium]|jgi:hypothetical protein
MTATPIYSILHRETGQWVEVVGLRGTCVLTANPHEAKRWCWTCMVLTKLAINDNGEFVEDRNPPPRNDGYVYTCECSPAPGDDE